MIKIQLMFVLYVFLSFKASAQNLDSLYKIHEERCAFNRLITPSKAFSSHMVTLFSSSNVRDDMQIINKNQVETSRDGKTKVLTDTYKLNKWATTFKISKSIDPKDTTVYVKINQTESANFKVSKENSIEFIGYEAEKNYLDQFFRVSSPDCNQYFGVHFYKKVPYFTLYDHIEIRRSSK
jgi:hypothetical protein